MKKLYQIPCIRETMSGLLSVAHFRTFHWIKMIHMTCLGPLSALVRIKHEMLLSQVPVELIDASFSLELPVELHMLLKYSSGVSQGSMHISICRLVQCLYTA